MKLLSDQKGSFWAKVYFIIIIISKFHTENCTVVGAFWGGENKQKKLYCASVMTILIPHP